MYVCASVWVHVCVSTVPTDVRRVGSTEVDMQANVSRLMWVLGTEPRPLEEEYVLLTAELPSSPD